MKNKKLAKILWMKIYMFYIDRGAGAVGAKLEADRAQKHFFEMCKNLEPDQHENQVLEDNLDALEAEGAGEAEAQVVRMWCVKTYWGWALWSSAPAAAAKLYPVWCEKTEIEGADHLTKHAPGAGDVLCAVGTETAYRIVAMDTGDVDLEAKSEAEEYAHMWAYRAKFDGWLIRHAPPDDARNAFPVMCRKVDTCDARFSQYDPPAVGETWKCDLNDDHAWRITGVTLPQEAQEETLYYMWAWHKRRKQWRISRTRRYEKVAHQKLVQCKKIDYTDNLPGVEDLAIGSKFTLPDVKTHAWEIVGMGRTKQPALEAFWCGRRDDLDDNWFIRNFDNRFTDAFQVWCEKVGNAEGKDYSDTRPVVGDILKFDRTDLNAYRITELPA